MKKVVGFLLVDKENRILLQHRTDDAPTNPSKWSIFGGGVEDGETSLTAVKRECLEELEYILDKPKLIFKNVVDGIFVSLYFELFDVSQELILHEGQAIGWYFYDELNSLDLADFQLDILLEIKKFLISD